MPGEQRVAGLGVCQGEVCVCVCVCVGVGVCRSARSTDRRKGSTGRLDLTASR